MHVITVKRSEVLVVVFEEQSQLRNYKKPVSASAAAATIKKMQEEMTLIIRFGLWKG